MSNTNQDHSNKLGEDKLDMQSLDLVNQNFKKLAELFPNCVTESITGKAIDFDLLKQELNHAVVEGNKERYRLEWPGKREAIVTANLPTTKTLRPVREDSVDFDNTKNIYIEGDNLEVLKLLQESYLGKIKMIYIDPPYNTGNDFVYKDNFAKDKDEELFESGQKDELSQRLVANPEASSRYHSNWLEMMYPRLKLARNLLSSDGFIFISIDDNELFNLQKVASEIFGEINYIGLLSVENNPKGRKNSRFISVSNDYCLIYAKNKEISSFVENIPKSADDMAEDENGNFVHKSGKRVLVGNNSFNKPVTDTKSEKHYTVYYNVEENLISLVKEVALSDTNLELISKGYKRYVSSNNQSFIENTYTAEKFRDLFKQGALDFKEDKIFEKNFNSTIRLKSLLVNRDYDALINNEVIKFKIDLKTTSAGTLIKELFSTTEPIFTAPKNTGLIKLLITLCSDNDFTVLDFFSGSATTAHAIMDLNAQFNNKKINYILVQLPEIIDESNLAVSLGYKNICDIGKERIRLAAKKIKEETAADIDYGFRVYRLDEGNMQDVYYRPQDLEQGKMDLFGDNVKQDRTEDDLLTQVMLDWGLPLSLKIEQANVAGKNVFKVAENSLFACFDKGIDEAFAKEIAKEKPLRIVFKDAGFKDDTAKTNVKQLLKQLSPETEMKVL